MRDRSLLGRTSLPACRASSRRGLRAARSLPAAHCVPVALRPEPAKPVRHGHGKGYSGGCGRSRPYCGRCKINGPVSGSLGSRARAKYTIYHIRVKQETRTGFLRETRVDLDVRASRVTGRAPRSWVVNPAQPATAPAQPGYAVATRHRLDRVPGRSTRTPARPRSGSGGHREARGHAIDTRHLDLPRTGTAQP